MKTLSNSLELSKLNLSIKDCLKIIGIKEITANVYEIPKKNQISNSQKQKV